MAEHILTEAEKEAMYDAERDGSLYAKPEPAEHDVELEIAEDIDAIIALLEQIEAAEQPSSLDMRFDAVVDAVAELPDDLRARAVRMWEGYISGLAIAQAVR